MELVITLSCVILIGVFLIFISRYSRRNIVAIPKGESRKSKFRFFGFFCAWCAVIFLSALYSPLVLIVLVSAYFIGLIPFSSQMKGLTQEVLYSGLVALIICLPTLGVYNS